VCLRLLYSRLVPILGREGGHPSLQGAPTGEPWRGWQQECCPAPRAARADGPRGGSEREADGRQGCW